MNSPVRVVRFGEVELTEPSVIKVFDENGDEKFYSLKKEAIRYLYKNLAMSFSESRILFKADKNSWRNYIEQQASREDLEYEFDLSDKYFIVYDNLIISITDRDISYDLDKFFSNLSMSNAKLDSNIVLYTKIPKGDNKIYLELDFTNGIYKIAYGMKLDDIHVLVSPCTYLRSIEELINYSIDYEYDLTENIVDTIGMKISTDSLKEIKMSVRELLDVSRICKYKFYTDKSGIVDPVQCTNEDLLEEIAKQFRITGIPFKSLKRMKYLEKSMKITDMTLYDLIKLYDEGNSKGFSYSLDLMNYLFYSVYYCGGDFKVLKK